MRMEVTQLPATWAEMGEAKSVEFASPPRGLAAAAPMLQERDGARGHFMRSTKGFIGSKNGLWEEGYTGQYNPVKPRDLTGEFPVALLPEVRQKDWITGLYNHLFIFYVTVVFLETCRAETELRKSAPRRRLAHDARRGARRWPAAVRVLLLSALTIAKRPSSARRLVL